MPHHASLDTGARQRSPASRHTKRRWPLLLGGLLVLLHGCATAPPVSHSKDARTQAKIAYLLNDYKRTFLIALPQAEAGEAWAQYTVGYLYYYGLGVALDKQAGKHWIESAAAKGYEPARQAMQRLSAQRPAAGTEQTPPAASPNKEPDATSETAPPAPAAAPSSPSTPLIPAPDTAPAPSTAPAQRPPAGSTAP
ncbi:MAG: hypothetical protein P8164_12540 [Gammaproteobacteria bacterium]|jgi:TPR repeat protein